jgi:hypothetical protein
MIDQKKIRQIIEGVLRYRSDNGAHLDLRLVPNRIYAINELTTKLTEAITQHEKDSVKNVDVFDTYSVMKNEDEW